MPSGRWRLKLAREQRKLARKTTRSNNWQKQKERITRLHIRTADMRNDYLHKLSTTISKSHAVVVLEDLKVKDMSASQGHIIRPWQKHETKEQAEQIHTRPGLGQLPVVPGIQAGATGWLGTLCQPGLYQPDLLGVRPRPPRQPQEPVRLRLPVLRVGDQRGPECRNQHLKGGARPVSLPSERCSNAVGNRNFKAGGLTLPVFGIPVSSGRGGSQSVFVSNVRNGFNRGEICPCYTGLFARTLLCADDSAVMQDLQAVRVSGLDGV